MCAELTNATEMADMSLVDELRGLRGDDLNWGDLWEQPVPLAGLDAAQLLAAGARAAAANTCAVTDDIPSGAGLLAQVVAQDGAADAAAEVHEQAVGDDGAWLIDRGGVQLRRGAQAAARPAQAAHDGVLGVGIRRSAAWAHLPHLVELASGTAPVDLIESANACNATLLDLSNALSENRRLLHVFDGLLH